VTAAATTVAALPAAVLAVVLAVALGCATRSSVRPSGAPPAAAGEKVTADRRIAFYRSRLEADPRHYPSLALLAGAELDRARETGDPEWLARARRNVDLSMAIQPNFEAMKTGAAIANYSHRFAEGAAWARRAREAWPSDTGVTALLAEAHLGLGEIDEAARLLAPESAPDDYHTAFARGLVSAARGEGARASEEFACAARFAAEAGAKELELFSTVSAAGALLDAGRPEAALPHLLRADSMDSTDVRLRIHRAEYLEATGRIEAALLQVEELIGERDGADLRRHAFRLARELGRDARAEEHFAAARRLYERPIAAGEVYTLEGLARLLAEAGVDLDAAVALAARNLEWKRDAAAHEALSLARSRR